MYLVERPRPPPLFRASHFASIKVLSAVETVDSEVEVSPASEAMLGKQESPRSLM